MNFNWNKNINFYILLFIFLFIVLIPTCPYIQRVPGRDSGVFLYAGQQILHGDIPYRDFWDHKPPLIFYINSIGLLLGANTIWGIWILEILFLFLAAILSFELLSQSFEKNLSCVITLLWLFSLSSIIQGGNLTTEYAIPIQFGILFLYFKSQYKSNQLIENKFQDYLIYFIIGILSSLLILLKPNLCSIPLALLIVLSLSYIFQNQESKNPNGKRILFFISGAILPIVLFCIYFLMNDSFFNFYDAVIHYNLVYSAQSSLMQKIFSIYTGVNLLFSIFIIALAGFFFWLSNIFLKKYDINERFHLLMVVSISFPLELLFTAYSGMGYGHYFMSWLPILAVLATYFLNSLIESLEFTFWPPGHDGWKTSKQLIVLSFIISLFFVPFSYTIAQDVFSISKVNQNDEVISLIENHTNTNDYVLLWGAETKYNFLTGRKSPTKYTYQYPLLTRNYDTTNKIQEFINEIQENKPKLIIDTSATNSRIPPLDYSKRNQWKNINDNSYDVEFEKFFRYFDENYKLIGMTKESKWDVYVIKTVNSSI